MFGIIRRFLEKRERNLKLSQLSSEYNLKIAKLRAEYNSKVKDFETEDAEESLRIWREYYSRIAPLKEEYDKEIAQLYNKPIAKLFCRPGHSDFLRIYYPETYALEDREFKEAHLVGSVWGKYTVRESGSHLGQNVKKYIKLRDEFLSVTVPLCEECVLKTEQLRARFNIKVTQLMKVHELKEAQLIKEYLDSSPQCPNCGVTLKTRRGLAGTTSTIFYCPRCKYNHELC